MQNVDALLNSESFSETVILNQVQEILEYPLFQTSGVLSRFLTYVVHETISGRSGSIKEYNIAISVLKKPAYFNTNQSGVVRVHARRLRDALSEYYIHRGTTDCCEIIIPKGNYIPAFRVFKSLKSERSTSGNDYLPLPGDPVKICVMPFKSFETDHFRLAMTDNVAQLLSNELSNLPNFSTLSYYSARQLHDKQTAIKEIAHVYGIHLILTGSIRFESTKMCVSLQLVNALSEMLIWSDHYLLDSTSSDLYEVEKVIVHRAMAGLKGMSEIFGIKIFNPIAKIELGSYGKKGVIDITQNRRNKKTGSY